LLLLFLGKKPQDRGKAVWEDLQFEPVRDPQSRSKNPPIIGSRCLRCGQTFASKATQFKMQHM